MTVKEIDFSRYKYKRVCVLGKTRVYFPPDTEKVHTKEYGNCVLASDPEEHNSDWLVLSIEI